MEGLPLRLQVVWIDGNHSVEGFWAIWYYDHNGPNSTKLRFRNFEEALKKKNELEKLL